MPENRFRWTTIQRALDVLQGAKSNAQMVALIEEVGCGPEFDKTSERTTPKLRNLLSRACRETGRTDPDGTPLGERIVREAVAVMPVPEPAPPWRDEPPHLLPAHQALLHSLAVDGWGVVDGVLSPVTSVPLEEPRDRLRGLLRSLSADEALRRLDQLEKGLDEGHWESANGDARGFLNAVFEVIAERWPATKGQDLREGAARSALQKNGFFKTDPKNPNASVEGDFIRGLAALLGSEGAHTGTSDQATAVFRYATTLIAAEYFLRRAI
jgi:hypothetical protein